MTASIRIPPPCSTSCLGLPNTRSKNCWIAHECPSSAALMSFLVMRVMAMGVTARSNALRYFSARSSPYFGLPEGLPDFPFTNATTYRLSQSRIGFPA